MDKFDQILASLKRINDTLDLLVNLIADEQDSERAPLTLDGEPDGGERDQSQPL